MNRQPTVQKVIVRRVCGACGKQHDPTARDKDGHTISCHQHAKNVRTIVTAVKQLARNERRLRANEQVLSAFEQLVSDQ